MSASDVLRHLLDLAFLIGLALAWRFRGRAGGLRGVILSLGPVAALGTPTLFFLFSREPIVGIFFLANLLASTTLLYAPAAVLLFVRRPARGAGPLRVTALLALCLAADVWLVEPNRLVEEHVVLTTDALPAGSRLVILHLSDPQMERMDPVHRKVLRRAREIRADLVVVTGDWIQEPFAIEDGRDFARGLSAPLGVFTVTGNTDGGLPYWIPPYGGSAAEGLARYHAMTGVRVLANETVRLDTSLAGPIEIVGIDFFNPDAAPLLSPRAAPFRLVLEHSPDVIFMPGATDADLVLAGHTHGGQIRIPFWGPVTTLTRLDRRIAAGGLSNWGRAWLYISRGIGMERGLAPRLRFNCPPEMTVIEVHGTGGGIRP